MSTQWCLQRRATRGAAVWISAFVAFWVSAACAFGAQATVDLRHSFPHIAPYTKPPSPPATADFSVPGPGLLHIRLVLSPYFRSMEPLRFRSKVSVDGADESVFRPRVPGSIAVDSKSTPERWVDGAGLEIRSTVRFMKARPSMQVGLFPSVVRHGDGSSEQLANSVQVQIWFEPDGGAGVASTAAPAVGSWATVIETLGNDRWTAEWTLLDDGKTFDATWRHEPGGDTGVNRRFAQLVSISGTSIIIDRPGLGRYTGTISADRRTISGAVSWANATWRATLRAPLPAEFPPKASR